MAAPADDIHGCAGAHRRLPEIVAGIGHADVGAASGLPSWTAGHVLTHLARNAEPMTLRHASIATERAGDFAARLEELVLEFVDGPSGGSVEFGLYVALYPTRRSFIDGQSPSVPSR